MNATMTLLPGGLPGLPASLSPAARTAAANNPRDIVDSWLRSLAPRSVQIYRRSLAAFAEWASPSTASQPEQVLALIAQLGAGRSHLLLCGYRDHILETGRSTSTAGAAVSAVCSLIRVAKRAGAVAFSLDGISPKRELVRDTSGPSRGEAELLLRAIDGAAAAGDVQAIRDGAIVRLLYCCGLRRNEVSTLDLAHLELDHDDGPSVRALRKGHRARKLVAISRATAPAIRAWLQIRGMEPGPLFYRVDRRSAAPTALSGDAIYLLVRSWGVRAGLRRPLRPHALRHSAITFVAERGNLAETMAVGGHDSAGSVSHYLDRRVATRRRVLDILDL